MSLRAADLDDYDLFWGPNWGTPREQLDLDSAHPADLAEMARYALDRLQERLLPPCDDRCGSGHDGAYIVAASLELQATRLGRKNWWSDPTALQRPRPWRWLRRGESKAWFASSLGHRLPEGTRLTRLTETDRYWVTHDTMRENTLFRIESGQLRGDLLMTTTFGPSPLPEAVAGALVVPDHPPARDPEVLARLLDYANEIQARGQRYEEAAKVAGPPPRKVASWRAAIEWLANGDPEARAALIEGLDPQTRHALLHDSKDEGDQSV